MGGAVFGYYANGAIAWGKHPLSPGSYDPQAEQFFNPRTLRWTAWLFRACLIMTPLFLALGFIPRLMAKIAEGRRKRLLRREWGDKTQ
jgi:hypothetical protein